MSIETQLPKPKKKFTRAFSEILHKLHKKIVYKQGELDFLEIPMKDFLIPDTKDLEILSENISINTRSYQGAMAVAALSGNEAAFKKTAVLVERSMNSRENLIWSGLAVAMLSFGIPTAITIEAPQELRSLLYIGTALLYIATAEKICGKIEPGLVEPIQN